MKTADFLIYIYTIIILFRSSLSTYNESQDISKYIKEIDASNFNSTLENNNVFLEFYTQWCGHCKALDKVLIELAQNLVGKNIIIAKLDAGDINNKEIVNLLKVESFPTFFFIVGGQYMHYQGSKTSEALTKYLLRELDTDLTNWFLQVPHDDISTLISAKKSILLFIGDGNKYLNEFNVYRRLVESYEKKVNIFWTNKEESFKLFNINAESYVIIYYNYMHIANRLSEPTVIDLNSLMDITSFFKMSYAPLFNKVDMEQLEKHVDNSVSSLILVHNDRNQTDVNSPTNKLIDSLIPIAELYKTSLYFFKLEYDENNLSPIFDNFEITSENQVPTCIIIEILSDGELNKYKLEGALTTESFKTFLNNYKLHNLSKIINSEEIPSQPFNQHGVMKVVRKNLNETVLSNDNQEFIILYCIKDSQKCDEVRSRFYQVSQRFNKSFDLKFAEYDANLNENDIIDINKIPELIYFPRSSLKKTEKLVRFSGNYTSLQMFDFITQNVIKENLVFTSLSSEEEQSYKNETLIQQFIINDEIEGSEANDTESQVKDGQEGQEGENINQDEEAEGDEEGLENTEVSETLNQTESNQSHNDTRMKDDL